MLVITLDIQGSYKDGDVGVGVLFNNTTWICRQVSTFWWNRLRDGGSKFLQNVGIYLYIYMALLHRSPTSVFH
jgi:hypothetical protein